MPSHTAITQRLDAPTIAFDRQPTVAVSLPVQARDLYEQSTASTLRPVVAPSFRDVPTVTTVRPSARAASKSRSMFGLCVLCLLLGIVAGHLVREGDAYGAALSSASAKLQGPPKARPAHRVEVVSARADQSGLRTKDVAAVATKVEPRAATRRGKGSSPAAAASNAADALFIDFEPTFRAPK